MPKFVISNTLDSAGWTNSTVVSGDVVDELRKLREHTSGDLLVAGSARLVHTLTEHDLVDEYRLMVFPILLGSGKRLFEERDTAQSLKLVESRPTADVVLVRLQPDRE